MSEHTFQLMGVVNVTPDSFSDGGHFLDPDKALRHIETLIQDGADSIDLGAESSRPGATPLSIQEEADRLTPILKKYKSHFDAPLSVDTTKSDIAALALQHGADMINDISGGTYDRNLIPTVARAKKTIILMHTQGTPETMQTDPIYTDVVTDVYNFLQQQRTIARDAGIQDIILDPGIGFGKTVAHNCTLIQHLSQFKDLGCPLLIGTSNKSFIGHLTGAPVDDRLPGTLVSNLLAIQKGVSIIRVHDVKSHYQARKLYRAITQP